MNKEHEAKKYTLKVFNPKASVYDFTPEMIKDAFIAGWNRRGEVLDAEIDEIIDREIEELLK